MKCPINNFQECEKEECCFYNLKLDMCLLPRALLAMIQTGHNTKEILGKEINYDGRKNVPPTLGKEPEGLNRK